MKVLEGVERMQAELKDLRAQLEGEQAKAQAMKSQITGQTTALQAEIDAIKPERDEAAKSVTPKAREAFDRLADRFEGEAMSPLIKPDKRREEYSCSACMMDLVRDVYNKLHTRDELVFCPSCRRILYIPEDLPVEAAVHKPKERKERAQKALPAATNRQTSAIDILRSVQAATEERDEATQAGDAPGSVTAEAAGEAAAEKTSPEQPGESPGDARAEESSSSSTPDEQRSEQASEQRQS